jgi:hypothetical protein
MPQTWRSKTFRLIPLALAVLALANSGCLMVAAGVAAGGAAAGGYAYYKGKVSREYVANLDDAWNACHMALADLGMPVSSEDRSGTSGSLESRTADGAPVHIGFTLENSRIPAQGSVTQVGVRVGTFSFGDQVVSERILDQIGTHLVPGSHTSAAVRAQTAPPPLADEPPHTAPPPLAPEPAPSWQAPAAAKK